MPEVSDYLQLNNCGWVDTTKGAWEELPYWLRGFGDLGYVTGNTRILTLARQWIDGIIANQAPTASSARTRCAPRWRAAPTSGRTCRCWTRSAHAYAATHTGDTRVMPFMRKYFQFQNAQPAAVFNRELGAPCAGATTSTACTGCSTVPARPGCSTWSARSTPAPPTTPTASPTGTTSTWPRASGSRRSSALLDPDPKFPAATYRDYDTVMGLYGKFPGGGFAGDENCRPGYTDPRQGFETCGIVEFMHSHQLLARMTGDSVWLDRCEDLAFNLLPASLDPAQQGIHYITCANSIGLTTPP